MRFMVRRGVLQDPLGKGTVVIENGYLELEELPDDDPGPVYLIGPERRDAPKRLRVESEPIPSFVWFTFGAIAGIIGSIAVVMFS